MSGHEKWVSYECLACHQSVPASLPVSLDTSAGAGGFSPKGCVGCHGREQDAGHDSISAGRGAGLRQHHFRALGVCADCHRDANPANYVPVVENIAPVNYFTPDTANPNKPTDPCNANGLESVVPGALGLDNDGNGLYDLDDPACQVCVGNCNGSGPVTIDEIITMVNIALGNADVSSCGAGDANGDHRITVDEILKAVNNALNGC
jgi:cytochrome c553